MMWWHALIQAGAVPGNGGKADDVERVATEQADLVEGSELQTYQVADRTKSTIPAAASFLNGMERWSVVAYDGVVQVVNAYVAAAVGRRAGTGGRRTPFDGRPRLG